jgi:hypothetical protein|tara:strand:+ start:1142 stop:1555 length:414 start_codon:yes stop_codon:yes gene_type:complete
MKVSISYTVDFDDVPEEVIGLLQKAEYNLYADDDSDSSFEDLRMSIKHKDFDMALEHMHNIRTRLADVDTGLNDCHQILEGYLKAKYSQSTTEPTTPTPVVQDPASVIPDGFDMNKALDSLKTTNPDLFPKFTKEEG